MVGGLTARDGYGGFQHAIAVAKLGVDLRPWSDRPVQVTAHRNFAIRFKRSQHARMNIFNESSRHHAQRHVAINSAECQIVDVLSERRNVLALGGIDRYGDHVIAADMKMRRDLERKRRVAAPIFRKLVTVYRDLRRRHRAGEIDEHAFALPRRRRMKVTPIRRDKLKVRFLKAVPGQADVGVRQRDTLPFRVVEGRRRESRRSFAAVSPIAVQIIASPRWNGSRSRGGSGFRLGLEGASRHGGSQEECSPVHDSVNVSQEKSDTEGTEKKAFLGVLGVSVAKIPWTNPKTRDSVNS